MKSATQQVNKWQLASKLEEGRNYVLRMVAHNKPLQAVLQALCEKAQTYNAEMFCSILRLDNEHKTLHPIASVSLPDAYCQALDGVQIGSGVGSCGTAAFTQKRVIVDDINTHPYWNQYKDLALNAGLQACWSEPIIGADGIVFGTFALYYQQPRKPTEEDLKFIEVSANLAAVVFENAMNREKLIEANNQLNKTIDQRNKELKKVNKALKKALKDQDKQHSTKLQTEKIATVNHLISGFSHEISTPVGNALTATTIAAEKLNQLNGAFASGKLTRSTFCQAASEIGESLHLSQSCLLRTNDLLQRFKDINTDTSGQPVCQYDANKFFEELSSSISNLLEDHELNVQCNVTLLENDKESLWQVFYNLIENSVTHGFERKEHGSILINVNELNKELVINYQDDGCGLTTLSPDNLFEPFHTTARHKKSLGLGLSITNNLVTHKLHGKIKLMDSPVGMRFEIRIPIKRP